MKNKTVCKTNIVVSSNMWKKGKNKKFANASSNFENFPEKQNICDSHKMCESKLRNYYSH
jgi:hypothetical protein